MMQTHQDVLYRDPKYRCCCGTTHVEKGAYYIAFLGALLSALALIGYFFTLNWPMFIIYVISLFVFLSIIVAQKKHNPNYYLPFLVINGITLFFTLANLVFLLIAIIVMPEFYTKYIRDTYDNVTHHHHDYTYNTVVYVVLGTALLITAITFAIYAWFYTIVLRAYQYMKDYQTMNVTTVPVGGGPVMHTYHSTTVQETQQKV